MAATPAPSFNRDIRPILSDNCFQCHGPDKAQRKAGLRLDVRESAVDSDAIVPGKPDESELIRRIQSDDPDEQMPPPNVHKRLTPEQKDLLSRWIAAGAEYEAHWAYLPIRRPAVPEVDEHEDASSGAPIRNPIDAFIAKVLTTRGLALSPEADKRTLLRRLSLDLTGLPPTPAEVAAFLRDTRPDAYARQVERLLASPHYGERMAVPWLDAVRFADTVGYHGDQNQRIFPYRDYVIESFNRNKPFDQFTIEQIAGDLLPNPTVEQLIATGFNRLNMMTREGGAQPKEYIAKYQADRVRTVSTTWLGATMACAECHDHKFDPFTTRDFYSMSAFFADIMQWGVYQDYTYTPNPDLRNWSNDHPFPPELQVPSPYLQRRIQQLEAAEADLCDNAATLLSDTADALDTYEAWRGEVQSFLAANPTGWRPVPVTNIETRSNNQFSAHSGAETRDDHSVAFSSGQATHDRITLNLPEGWFAAIKLELLPDENTGRILRGNLDGTTLRLTAELRSADAEQPERLAFHFADADEKLPIYANGHDVLGITGGWKVSATRSHQTRHGIWLLAKPRKVSSGDVLHLTIPNNAAARLRVSVSPLALEPGHWPERLTEVSESISERGSITRAYHRSTAWNAELTEKLRRLDNERRECRDGMAWTMITVSTNPLVTRVLPRGNWMDESGPIVESATPSFLPSAISAAGRSSDSEVTSARLTRLDLAEWIVSPENPLTARNFVNRLWAQFFGRGISARVEDLGLQGEWPTHPELLDWLASEFMQPTVPPGPEIDAVPDQGWNIKHLVRLIVLSSTYRQASVPSERALEVDPENHLLSYHSPRRLEAEFIRDNALAVSGLLNPELGGPSVFPYQPPDYYANLQFPDRDYIPNGDTRQYRRGVYVHWQRTFLHPMLANFDAQSREECVAARLLSNTPQQALTLLNDPTFVEASRALAERVLRKAERDDQRIDLLFERALLRDPKPRERDSLLKFLAAQRSTYNARPEDAKAAIGTGIAPVPTDIPPGELAAWMQVARVVLNLHEFITLY